jgi:hypothetical protein
MNPRPATNQVADPKSLPPTVLRGRTLFVARRVWVALAALTFVLFFASIPVAFNRLHAVCESAGCIQRLTHEGAEALEGLHLSLGIYAAYHTALAIGVALGYWLIGATLFWKRSDDRLVLYASMALVAFGAMQPDTLRGLAKAYPVLDLPIALVYFVGESSFFILFCLFPDGRFVPRWTRWTACVWIFYWALSSFFPDAPFSPSNWPLIIDASLLLGLICSLVVAQIYRYRRVSEQIARQQTKWVVFGFTVAIVAFVGVVLIGWIYEATQSGSPELLYESVGALAIALSALLIPLSIGIAILHYRLWDIDLVINRALVYGPLSAVLTGVFASTDLLLHKLFFHFSGVEETPLTYVGAVLVIAVAFQPLRKRIEGVVDKLTEWLVGGDQTSASHR